MEVLVVAAAAAVAVSRDCDKEFGESFAFQTFSWLLLLKFLEFLTKRSGDRLLSRNSRCCCYCF